MVRLSAQGVLSEGFGPPRARVWLWGAWGLSQPSRPRSASLAILNSPQMFRNRRLWITGRLLSLRMQRPRGLHGSLRAEGCGGLGIPAESRLASVLSPCRRDAQEMICRSPARLLDSEDKVGGMFCFKISIAWASCTPFSSLCLSPGGSWLFCLAEGKTRSRRRWTLPRTPSRLESTVYGIECREAWALPAARRLRPPGAINGLCSPLLPS